ncbi:SURF1 family cytochrome oxidase biogenesis protein [Streptomyces griseoloalbus]|uniref:SURF1-like protein n=1 Tax=Streptomyces griseoloalbus TaxID=67303 RepID=A0A7W8FA81_9ACTN|nr:SURF1 family protein [Streptomyces albaduncus]MBB5126950.1 cytochrome oxidase assembly protein ShyY1 [Streptomyces albaduncus]
MHRFLLSRQWVIITLVALLLVPTMIRLGIWQMDRYGERSARNQLVTDALAAEPVPVERLAAPGHAVTRDERYRTVTARGHFVTDDEVVVRRRTNADDEVGFHVLTPFVLDDGKVLLVNRGWIPADGPSQTAFPQVPAPPRGEITIKGRLMPDETTEASGIKDLQGLPDRQIMLINSEREAKRLGARVLGGYVAQTAPEAKGAIPERLGSPGEENAALNYAYAVQWWLFAAAVPVGWVVLVRREARERARAAAEKAAPENPGETGETGAETGAAAAKSASVQPARGHAP